MESGGCQVNPEVILAVYVLVLSSVFGEGQQGRAQGMALYRDQQPQLLGTKGLLLRDHVTVCVPPLSCDVSSGQGLRSAESL